MSQIIVDVPSLLPQRGKTSIAGGASWPYVDRRGTVKSTDIHPLRRASETRQAADKAKSQHLLPWLARPVRWDALYAAAVGAADIAVCVGAAVVATGLSPRPASGSVAATMTTFGPLLVPAAWLVCLYLQRGYERRLLGAGADEFRRVVIGAVTLFAACAVVEFATHSNMARTYIAVAIPVAAFGSLMSRYFCRQLLHVARRRGHCLTNVLLVGPGGPVLQLAQQLKRERLSGLHVVGACVPDTDDPSELLNSGLPVMGDLFHAAQVVRETGVGAVAVTACAEMNGAALRQLAWDLENTGADLIVAPALLEIAGPRLHLRPTAGLSLLHVEEPELDGGRRLLKGAMDRILALAGSAVLAPAFLVIACAIRLNSPGPAFYRQVRVGRNGEPFQVYKFRSMYVDADNRLAELEARNEAADGLLFKIRDDPRVTRVGRWIRKYSLDELPQLINVLRGEMSLVGPRPPLPSEVARYGSAVQRRLLVKPGVTGLWQVSGRSDLTWDESVRLDLRYVENWSLMLDISILWKTVFAVVRGSGAY